MKLPHAELAVIPPEKIKDYLLCLAHREGRGKAQWFMKYGFSLDNWEQLVKALRVHAQENEVTKNEDSPFGRRYIIEGPLQAADGRSPFVRVVWFREDDLTLPRLVTAYPLEQTQ